MLEEIIILERNMKLEFGKLLHKKASHKCLYPNCKNDAILSHSISKSTLKNIVKDNDVKFQKFNRAEFTLNDFLEPKKINMEFKNININSASTFKGFCVEHDNNIFESIDNKGILTLRDIYLQLYRTSAKQYFLNNMTKKAELKIFQEKYYTNEEFEQKKVINLENIVLLLNDLLVDFPELEQQFSLKNSEVLWLKPFSKNVPIRDVQIMFKKLSVKYPIALESSYTLKINQEYHSNVTILLPTKEETLLFVLCHKDDVTQYTPHFQSELKILNFIESLIMTDSEFYLDPIEFEMWDNEKINIIEQDLYFLNERKFLQEYDISIFNNIRKQIIKDQSTEIQEHENNKVNNKPKRLDLKTRFWDLGQFIELSRRKMQNTTKQSSQ